jgi:hypothetical protein
MNNLFGLDRHFYNGSIRRYVALFGSIFEEIYIKRKSDDGTREDTVKVPIRYGPGNMYLKVPQDEGREVTKHSRILPAMGFKLDNMFKDVSRKTNPMNRINQAGFDENGKRGVQFNRIPYNFIFELLIRTKNSDDMLQIVEQIVPAFDGNLSATIQDVNSVSIEQDIIITLQEISMEDNFEDEMQGRIIEYKITFELKGFLYKNTNSVYVVKEVDILGAFDSGSDIEPEIIIDNGPITDQQDITSDLNDVMNSIPTTPVKKVGRGKRKG